MLFDKSLQNLEESDLQTLIENNVREGREVEYKEALTIHSEEQKQEFLNDVSSFANAGGGYLIYGIKERKEDAGIPVEVCGLKGENPGKRIVDMENIIRTGLEPRLYGVSIVPVSLPSHEGSVAIALHIPRSYAAPHMIKSSGRFYSRNSAGKFPLDVSQLRTAFELLGATSERIRNFRAERLSRIIAGEELPASPLDEQAPKLVLHIIPFGAFDISARFDMTILTKASHRRLIEPISLFLRTTDHEQYTEDGLVSYTLTKSKPDLHQKRQFFMSHLRYNVDGLVSYTMWEGTDSPQLSYVQVFRNGIVEAVDSSVVDGGSDRLLSGNWYERYLIEALSRYGTLLKVLGVDPPLFVMVSLLGVKGYKIAHPAVDRQLHKYSIDRSNLVIPEIVMDHFDNNVAQVMKPIFDTVWNATGFAGSMNYDTSGEFNADL